MLKGRKKARMTRITLVIIVVFLCLGLLLSTLSWYIM
jgi:preprotein translocase subunit SecG